jgi:hypothetical protein
MVVIIAEDDLGDIRKDSPFNLAVKDRAFEEY